MTLRVLIRLKITSSAHVGNTIAAEICAGMAKLASSNTSASSSGIRSKSMWRIMRDAVAMGSEPSIIAFNSDNTVFWERNTAACRHRLHSQSTHMGVSDPYLDFKQHATAS